MTCSALRHRCLALTACVVSALVVESAPATAQNIIVNGDFSSGTSGFSSDYTYTPGPNTAEAQYNVLTNAKTWNGGFYALPGPSGSGDPYYAGNGASDVNKMPWYEVLSGSTVTGVTVTNNTNNPVFYRFETLIANLVPPTSAAPALYFEINVNNNGWQNFTRSINTPSNAWGTNYIDTYFLSAPTSLGFRLRNFETAVSGNDFALDNIYFGPTLSAPSYATNPRIISAGDIANPTYNTGATYWAANGSGAGGTDTWSTDPANTFWAAAADGNGFKQTWYNDISTNQAFFGGVAGTVTVDGTVATNQMSFSTTGYVIAPGASTPRINYTGSGPTINLGSGVTTTINVPQAGSGGLAITGSGARGTLNLGGNNSYTGGTVVTNSLLSLSGTILGNLSLDATSGLAGTGKVGGTISGAGSVAPGNSPGILTAGAVDPSGGLDFTFEFSGTTPNYASASASVNDVLRLTSGTPFSSALTSANTKTLFLNFTKDALTVGTGSATILEGGFFTDNATNFTSMLNNQIWDNAGFTVYVLGDGNGTDTVYNGQHYYNWRNPAMFGWTQSLFLSTTAETANFAGGTVNGQVMLLTVAVPEPSTYALGLCGAGFLALVRWSRRRRTTLQAGLSA